MFLTASWSAQPHWACCPTPDPRSWAGWRSWCRGEAHCCPRHSSWWSLLRVTRPPHRTPAGTWGSGRWPGAWTSQSWTLGRHHVTLWMNKTHKWKIISEICLRVLIIVASCHWCPAWLAWRWLRPLCCRVRRSWRTRRRSWAWSHSLRPWSLVTGEHRVLARTAPGQGLQGTNWGGQGVRDCCRPGTGGEGDECKPRQLAWGNQADPPGANPRKIANPKNNPKYPSNQQDYQTFSWSGWPDHCLLISPAWWRPWSRRALVSSLAVARVAGLTPDPGASSPWRPLPRPPLPSSFGKQLILKCFTITKITAGTRHQSVPASRPLTECAPRPHLLLLPPFYRNLPTLHIGVRGCNNVTQGLTPRSAQGRC